MIEHIYKCAFVSLLYKYIPSRIVSCYTDFQFFCLLLLLMLLLLLLC